METTGYDSRRWTIRDFFENQKEALGLTILAGAQGMDRVLEVPEVQRPSMALMGWYERFAEKRLQIFGRNEMSFIQAIDPNRQKEVLENLFKYKMPCVIISNGIIPPQIMLDIADRTGIPLLSSTMVTIELMNKISMRLQDQYAKRISVYGTLMDIYGIGIMYLGKSGIGKSEIALDLVKRGHRFVADDIVEIRKMGDDILIGSGVSGQGHFMQVRGIGLIDIEKLFGIRSIRKQKRIELVISLAHWEDAQDKAAILGDEKRYQSFMGVNIEEKVIPVSPGKSISTISEVIAMNFMLNTYGIDSAKEFLNRQAADIARKTSYIDRDLE